MLAKLVTSTSLVLLIPFSSIASDIRQRPFTYSYDAANAQSEDLFVVCSDCPDNKLSLQPVTPKLAVRMSSIDITPSISTAGEVAAESPKKEKPEIKGMIGTVHFDFDSSKLSSLEQSRLEQLLNEIPEGKSINVTGFTCSIGTGEYNKKLSFRRANAVATALKAKGVNISTIEGSGNCCPVSQDKRLNRRVEILGPRKEDM